MPLVDTTPIVDVEYLEDESIPLTPTVETSITPTPTPPPTTTTSRPPLTQAVVMQMGNHAHSTDV